jgi:hypothetical protein
MTTEIYLKTIGSTQFQICKEPIAGTKYYFVQDFVCYFILDTELFEEKGYQNRLLTTKVNSNWDSETLGWDHANTDQGNHFVRIFLDDDLERVPLVSE